MMPRIHKTPQNAALWFKKAMASVSKEQVEAKMEGVKEKWKGRKELDTKTKKPTAINLTDVAKMSTPDQGIRYEEVARFDDEVKLSSAHGTMWIRIQNLTFQLSAYQSHKQPQPPFDLKNPMAFVKSAMDVHKKWLANNPEQRKNDIKRLAPSVVKAITARKGSENKGFPSLAPL